MANEAFNHKPTHGGYPDAEAGEKIIAERAKAQEVTDLLSKYDTDSIAESHVQALQDAISNKNSVAWVEEVLTSGGAKLKENSTEKNDSDDVEPEADEVKDELNAPNDEKPGESNQEESSESVEEEFNLDDVEGKDLETKFWTAAQASVIDGGFDQLYKVIGSVTDFSQGEAILTPEMMIAKIDAVRNGEMELSEIEDTDLMGVVEALMMGGYEEEKNEEDTDGRVRLMRDGERIEDIEEEDEDRIELMTEGQRIEDEENPEEEDPDAPPTNEAWSPETQERIDVAYTELTDARNLYIIAHNAHMQQRRSGAWNRMKEAFGAGKEDTAAEIPEDLRIAKIRYDAAKIEMANAFIAARQEEGMEEAEAQIDVFNQVFIDERDEIRKKEAESWPTKDRNLFEKAVEGYRKVPAWLKIGTGVALIGAGIAIPPLGAGVLVAKRIMTFMGGAGIGGAIYDKFSPTYDADGNKEFSADSQRRIDELTANQMAGGEMTEDKLREIENGLRIIEKQDDSNKGKKRFLSMLAGGAGGLLLGHYASEAIGNWINGSEDVVADAVDPTPEVVVEPTPEVVDPTPEVVVEPTPEVVDPTPEVVVEPTPEVVVEPTPEVVDPVETPADKIINENPINPDAVPEGFVPVGEAFSTLDPEVAGNYFQELHDTPFNSGAPIDQEKMIIIEKLHDAGIMGTSGGINVPSPTVDFAINSLFDNNDVRGWSSVASLFQNNPGVLSEIKTALASGGGQEAVKEIISSNL